VRFVEAGHSCRAAARQCAVSVAFAVKPIAAFRRTGSFAPKPEGGWRYSKLDRHRDFLLRRVAETSDITMPELPGEFAALGTRVTPASISRWFIRHGYRFRKTLRASEQERPNVRQARAHWRAKCQPRMRQEPHRLVFIDETGTTTKMTRLRGRCPRGERLYAKAPFGQGIGREPSLGAAHLRRTWYSYLVDRGQERCFDLCSLRLDLSAHAVED
jgi:transposase